MVNGAFGFLVKFGCSLRCSPGTEVLGAASATPTLHYLSNHCTPSKSQCAVSHLLQMNGAVIFYDFYLFRRALVGRLIVHSALAFTVCEHQLILVFIETPSVYFAHRRVARRLRRSHKLDFPRALPSLIDANLQCAHGTGVSNFCLRPWGYWTQVHFSVCNSTNMRPVANKISCQAPRGSRAPLQCCARLDAIRRTDNKRCFLSHSILPWNTYSRAPTVCCDQRALLGRFRHHGSSLPHAHVYSTLRQAHDQLPRSFSRSSHQILC